MNALRSAEGFRADHSSLMVWMNPAKESIVPQSVQALRVESPEPHPPEGGTSFAITLMEHLVVPTFVLDEEKRVLIWNHACERLTGIKASEVVGTRDHWRAFYDVERPCLADLVAHGNKDEITKLYTVFEDSAEPSFGIHAENWCKMPRLGRRLYLSVDAGPVYDAAGRLVAVVQTVRDMTDKKNAEDMLKRMASQDFLTGLANRHAFDEALKLEWRRALRQQSYLSLVMLDADHFKAFNDTYGHLQGDACLRSIGAALAENCARAGDLAARYGGEEFALLLPLTDQHGAMAVAERIRGWIQALAIPHAFNGESDSVTISAGVATLVPTAEDRDEDLVRAADQALYTAKRQGRNCVVSAA